MSLKSSLKNLHFSKSFLEKFKIEAFVSISETGDTGTKFNPNLKSEISPSVMFIEERLKILTFILECWDSNVSSDLLVLPSENKDSLVVSQQLAVHIEAEKPEVVASSQVGVPKKDTDSKE